ncbi:nucleotidyltransferase [Sphingobacterium sp. UBA5996]|uniref:nucleotidyltransferase n=1 Tax=Sphingobacterium sp. UBA5996 TaxID=1947505 RepID=UPI0025E74ABF|nr:nucleotidyltransferase [Sphingobacterium sp. UBA5996]
MAVNRNDHLQSVLQSHRMSHIESSVEKYKEKRNSIKEALEERYGSDIYGPFNSGSYAKHTAVNCKFDLDLVVPFKRNSYATLREMFEDVYDYLYETYKDIATIRKQKVSIGVIFDKDSDGDIVSIDVVPGRELTADDYPESRDLNVFFNEGMGFIQKDTYLKTNIDSQIDHIKARDNERKIIRLLKLWKYHNGEQFKSFLMELLVVKAFDKTSITGGLWDKLKGVMTYVQENITKETFTLVDPGNSNNDVMESLDTWQRENLANRFKTVIERIEESSENIKSYFPINEQFEEQKTTDNSYGIKGPAIIHSIPKDTERFG